MTDQLLKTVEARLDELIRHCAHLEKENAELKRLQQGWNEERTRLVEKNNQARKRVEAMITHLKNLEPEPQG